MTKQLFERPLDDRYDRNVFMLAFFVGVVGILVMRIIGDQFADPAKPLAPTDFIAVLFSVSVIILYTLFIARATFRAGVSLDRAGDNAYYLGLLFTLVSLAYSLYKVAEIVGSSSGVQVDGAASLRSSDRVVRLLPDFGLALASTIAGIFCRVLVQQFRSDPTDIETQARHELGRAVWELRASLLRAVADINSLSQSTNAATTEMVLQINKTLEEAAGASASTVNRIGSEFEKLAQEVASQTRMLAGVLSRLNTDQTEVQGRLGGLSTELENLQAQISRTSRAQQNVAQELASVSAQLASLFSADVASRLRSSADETLRRQDQVLSQLGGLEISVSETRQKIFGLTEDISKTGDELTHARETSRQMLDSTVTASSEYIDGLTAAAKKLRRVIDDNK